MVSPQKPMSASVATAVTVTLCPTSGREVAMPPTLVVTWAIDGECDPQVPTESASVAGRLCRPLVAVATSDTMYVPGAFAVKPVVDPVEEVSAAPAGETLHANWNVGPGVNRAGQPLLSLSEALAVSWSGGTWLVLSVVVSAPMPAVGSVLPQLGMCSVANRVGRTAPVAAPTRAAI